MNAQVVLGLGFGDEGKGITTDYLCIQNPDSLVVRFSGGQQAGHTVMIGDQKHTHSSFGSGTLRGLPSYFTEHTTICPTSMVIERDILAPKIDALGTNPIQYYVHPLAKVTTPYDVLSNKAKFSAGGPSTVGKGIGKTMRRHLTSPNKLHAVDLLHPSILKYKMKKIKEYYLLNSMFEPSWNKKEEKELVEAFYRDVETLKTWGWSSKIKGYNFLDDFENVIFEGSQGILLDMDHGYFPHVTYANTTGKNAYNLIDNSEYGRQGVDIFYVMRAYQTRHGIGPMSNEVSKDTLKIVNDSEEINQDCPFRGPLRVGLWEYSDLEYAYAVDKAYMDQYHVFGDDNLIITCLDQVNTTPSIKSFKKIFKTNNIFGSHSPYADNIMKL